MGEFLNRSLGLVKLQGNNRISHVSANGPQRKRDTTNRKQGCSRVRFHGGQQNGYSDEDVVQEVLIRLGRAATFQTLSQERQSRFVVRVARNRCIDLLTRCDDTVPLDQDVLDTKEGPLDTRVSLDAIEAFMRKLPANLACVIEAMLLCDWDKARAAQVLGVSKKSLQNRWGEIIKRARAWAQ